MIDYKAIRRDADCIYIAQAIGLHVETRGNRTCILCPEPDHDDHHIGNCTLDRHGYHCFACDGHGDAVRLVEKSLGCSKWEAIQRVVDTLPGDRSQYIIDDDPNRPPAPKFPLTDEQVQALGLQMTWHTDIPMSIVCSRKEAYDKGLDILEMNSGDDETYVAGKHEYFSLQRMFIDDPESFWTMVNNQAANMYERYDTMLQIHFAELELGGVVPDDDIYHIVCDIKRRRRTCKNLIQEKAERI